MNGEDAIKYQMMSGRTKIVAFMLVVVMCIGLSVMLFGITGAESRRWLVAFVGAGFYTIGALGIGIVRGARKDGLCRRLFSWLGADYEYPPLDDWHDNLKESGAFEVSYE